MGKEFIVDNASFSSLDEALEKSKMKEVVQNENAEPEDEEVDECDECESEPEEEEEDDYDDDAPIIRCKWQMDGASTLDEAIEKMYEFIEYLRSLQAEGWELRDTVDDDYGFLKKVNV